MAYLTANSGSAFGKRYEIDKPSMVMGRHPDCEMTLDSGAVSRQHARLQQRDGQVFIEDLKSRNGTFINGRLITDSTRLIDGDLIRICDLEFSFHSDRQEDLAGTFVGGSSSFGVLLVDDNEQQTGSRAVTGKIDIRSSVSGSQLTASPEMRLQALLEITQSLGRAVELEEVLPKVLDTLFRIFVQADRAFIVLVTDQGELIPQWVKTRHPDQADSFRISRTVMREVMESKQAIMSLDASSDERFEMANSIADFRIRSMIVAPLLDSDERPLGAIQIDTLNPKRRFESADLEILASIALQAGVAIENAQLHEELVQKRLVEQDLELARSVQRAFLPSHFPDLAGYSFFHFYQPAQQIGGDYFDYIQLPDGRLAIIVADVVGHGVAAAMLMAKVSTETRFSLASHATGAQAICSLNQSISQLGVDKFVTFLCLILDPRSGSVDIINAGHMAPLWRSSGNRILEPGDEQAGIPVGIMEDFEYEMATIQIQPGDQLLMYTDGINEAPNLMGDMYGINRLRDLMVADHADIQSLGSRVIEDVQKFIAGTEQADDMCLVAIGRLG